MPKNREQQLLSDLAAMEADYLHGKAGFEAFLDRWAVTIANIQTALDDNFLSDYAVQCISDTFNTVLAPAAIIHQAISQAESAIVDDVANALQDLALFVPDDNDNFVDDPEPPNHLQNWLLANIHYPFVTSAGLSDDFLALVDMNEASFDSWLLEAREKIGWNRLASQFAKGDPRTMQKLCTIVFNGASSNSKSLNKTAQSAQSQFIQMKAEIENFCEPSMPAWMEEAQRRIQEIKMRPDIEWEEYDEWEEDDEDSLFELDDEPVSLKHEPLAALSFTVTGDGSIHQQTSACDGQDQQPEPAPILAQVIKAEPVEEQLTVSVDTHSPSDASTTGSERGSPTASSHSEPSPPAARVSHVGSKRKLAEFLEVQTTLPSFSAQSPQRRDSPATQVTLTLSTACTALETYHAARPSKRMRRESPGVTDVQGEVQELDNNGSPDTLALLNVSSPVSCATSPLSPASSTSGSESGSPYNPPSSPTNPRSPSPTNFPKDAISPTGSACTASTASTLSEPSPSSNASSHSNNASSPSRSFHQDHYNLSADSSFDNLKPHTQHQSSVDRIDSSYSELSPPYQKYSSHHPIPSAKLDQTSPLIPDPSLTAVSELNKAHSYKPSEDSRSPTSSNQVQIASFHQEAASENEASSSRPNAGRISIQRKRKRKDTQPRIHTNTISAESSTKDARNSPPRVEGRRVTHRYKTRTADGRPNKTLMFSSRSSSAPVDRHAGGSESPLSPPVIFESSYDSDTMRPFKRAKQSHGDHCLGRIT